MFVIILINYSKFSHYFRDLLIISFWIDPLEHEKLGYLQRVIRESNDFLCLTSNSHCDDSLFVFHLLFILYWLTKSYQHDRNIILTNKNSNCDILLG